MIIAMASPRIASTLEEGQDQGCLSEALAQGAEVACFPEVYLPGLRGQDFEVLPFDRAEMDRKVYWCRSSTSRRQPACWPLDTPPSAIKNPVPELGTPLRQAFEDDHIVRGRTEPNW